MAPSRIVVSIGRIDAIEQRYCPEDGDSFGVPIAWNTVSFSTAEGVEWTLAHRFAASDAGAAQAARVAARVQRTIDGSGIAALNDAYWAQRVIYGSTAYQAEEYALVARERADALWHP